MSSQSMTALSKLPFWRTLGACYVTVARNFWQLVRISWLWLLIMLPVYAAMHWLVWPWTSGAQQQAEGIIGLATSMLPSFIEIPALASIAVAWHRLVLREEAVSSAFYLRLDHVVWWYALMLFAFLVLAVGPFLQAGAWATTPPDHTDEAAGWLPLAALLVTIVVAVAISFAVLPRLSLVLPAIALGERLSLAGAWRATRGNTWRLAWASLLCSLPPLVPSTFLLWYVDSSVRTASVIAGAVASLAYVLVVTIAVTLLSLAYRHFVRQQDVGASPAA
jgi:hypothetical protein